MVRMLGITTAIVACLVVGTCNACSCLYKTIDQRYCEAKSLIHVKVNTNGVLVFPGNTYQQVQATASYYENFGQHQHGIQVMKVIRKASRFISTKVNVLQTAVGSNMCGVQLPIGEYLMEVYPTTSITPPFGAAVRTGSCNLVVNLAKDRTLLDNPPNCKNVETAGQLILP